MKVEYQLWVCGGDGWYVAGFFDTVEEARAAVQRKYRTAIVIETRIVRVETVDA